MRGRVGILGGMFDPIHRGHTDIAGVAAARLDLEAVFIVPASIPPHRPQPFASAFHRFAMVALAVAERPGWHACDMELLREAPSYTAATLRAFHERGHRPSDIFFVAGADAFADIDTWKDYPHLLDLAHFVVVSRPGCGVGALPARLPALAGRMISLPLDDHALDSPSIVLIEAPTTAVSSTDIRRRCADGQPIAQAVDEAVQQHIERHELYRSGVDGARQLDHPPHRAAGRLHG